jgi:hypothetical protein
MLIPTQALILRFRPADALLSQSRLGMAEEADHMLQV